MSAAVAERGVTPEEPAREGMSGGMAFSAALHLLLIALFMFGLPHLFRSRMPDATPIAVSLVTIGPETRATHPNPEVPRPEAKPETPLAGPPAEKLQPQPVPRQAIETPPEAVAPPRPEVPQPPEPKPQPAKLAEPVPAPPPLPKPPEAKPVSPKPLETVDVPRPKSKPMPPKETAEQATKPPPKRNETAQFQALLKNLTAAQATEGPQAPPQRQPNAAGRASSQPQAPLGSQMTASEIDLIREQISRCWNIPAGARDAKDLVVEIRVQLNPDGTVEAAQIVDQGRLASDPFFRAAAESARRAFFNPMCTPLRLPPDKYAVWRDLVVDFSPKDLL
jgi:outer membrane biosynthesis protein TonB